MINIISIHDFQAPELAVFSGISERDLAHFYEPKPGLFIAETALVTERALDAGYEPLSFLIEERQLESHRKGILAKAEAVKTDEICVYTAPEKVLSAMVGFSMTRGVLCAMRRKELPSVEEICRNSRRLAVLDQVMNPANVGAIVRSAAALHMDGVLFMDGCSDPLYRRAIRVSMGCIFSIPWTIFPESGGGAAGIEYLKRMGFHTVAMALREDSVPVDHPALKKQEKLAVVLGAEGDGLPQDVIDACDDTVLIPMAEGIDSLNVAAASAVAFWEMGKQEIS